MAVFTKILDDHEGFIYDENYSMNAWENEKVRQKPIMDDIKDFIDDYEKGLKVYEEKQGIPQHQSSQNEMRNLIQTNEEEKKQSEVEMGSLTQQKIQKREKEAEQFPFVKLMISKP